MKGKKIMLELQKGFITTEDLAEWSGLSVSNLMKHKKQWCEKNLSKYAEYELKRGGVVIIKIIEPIFQGSGFKEVCSKYEDYYGHDGIKADTARNCWSKLSPNMNNKLTSSTGIGYVSKARVQDYGTARKSKQRNGTKGFCHFVFGKIVNGEYYPFTDEEEKLKKELWRQYFHDINEEVIEGQQALNWAWKHKEITAEEYAVQMAELLDKEVNWIDFQIALEDKLEAKVDFRVALERCAWYDKQEEKEIETFDF